MGAEVKIANRVVPFYGIAEAMGRRAQLFLVGKEAYRTKKEPRIAVSLMLRGFKRGQRL